MVDFDDFDLKIFRKNGPILLEHMAELLNGNDVLSVVVVLKFYMRFYHSLMRYNGLDIIDEISDEFIKDNYDILKEKIGYVLMINGSGDGGS